MKTWKRWLAPVLLSSAVVTLSGLYHLEARSEAEAEERPAEAVDEANDNEQESKEDQADDDESSAGVVREDAEPKEEDDDSRSQLTIFSLKNMRARDLREFLTHLFSDEIERVGVERFKIEIVPQSNKLVVKASPDIVLQITALLQELDTPDAAARSGEEGGANLFGGGGPIASKARQLLKPESATRSPEIARLENNAQSRAAELRRLEKLFRPDDKRLIETRELFRGAVAEAFAAKQNEQKLRLNRLRERLQEVEKQVELREQHSQEIIDRRVRELLNPEDQWESDSLAGEGGADRKPGDDERPIRQPSPIDTNEPSLNGGGADTRVAGSPFRAVKGLTDDNSAGGVGGGDATGRTAARRTPETAQKRGEDNGFRMNPGSFDSGIDPRKALMEAQFDVETAISNVDDAKAELENAEKRLNLVNSMRESSRASYKEVLEVESVVDAANRKVSRAKKELEGKKRLVALAEDVLEGAKEAARSELSLARAKFEAARNMANRLRAATESGAVSESTLIEAEMKLMETAAENHRLEQRVVFLSKPLPGAKVDANETGEPAKRPAPQE